jgi:Asp-tRNA(Asn)/Glu-tRNA(Gln) amidotransferase A subunit family amidase
VEASSPAAQALLAHSVRRLQWLRHLPTDRRWGRDLQRVRAAYDVLVGPSVAVPAP